MLVLHEKGKEKRLIESVRKRKRTWLSLPLLQKGKSAIAMTREGQREKKHRQLERKEGGDNNLKTDFLGAGGLKKRKLGNTTGVRIYPRRETGLGRRGSSDCAIKKKKRGQTDSVKGVALENLGDPGVNRHNANHSTNSKARKRTSCG